MGRKNQHEKQRYPKRVFDDLNGFLPRKETSDRMVMNFQEKYNSFKNKWICIIIDVYYILLLELSMTFDTCKRHGCNLQ